MLKNIGSVSAWVESPLYEHMAFCREGREEFTTQLRRNLSGLTVKVRLLPFPLRVILGIIYQVSLI